MRAPSIALFALPVSLLVGCSSGGSDGAAAPARATTTTAVASATTSTSAAPAPIVPFEGSTDPTASIATTETTAFLRSVSVSHRDGVDRVTFQFDGTGRPKTSLAYVDRPVADGSGEAVAVRGAASLQVRFEPAATTDLRGETPHPIYTGPARVTGDSKVVTEVVKGGDFEGVLTWFIGVKTKAPFRIVPSGPSTVTIEIAAP